MSAIVTNSVVDNVGTGVVGAAVDTDVGDGVLVAIFVSAAVTKSVVVEVGAGVVGAVVDNDEGDGVGAARIVSANVIRSVVAAVGIRVAVAVVDGDADFVWTGVVGNGVDTNVVARVGKVVGDNVALNVGATVVRGLVGTGVAGGTVLIEEHPQSICAWMAFGSV